MHASSQHGRLPAISPCASPALPASTLSHPASLMPHPCPPLLMPPPRPPLPHASSAPPHVPGALPPLAIFRLLFEGPAPGVGAAPSWFWRLPKTTLPPPTAQLEEPPAPSISLASGPNDLFFTVTALPSVDFTASFASPTVYGYQQTCVRRCSKQCTKGCLGVLQSWVTWVRFSWAYCTMLVRRPFN